MAYIITDICYHGGASRTEYFVSGNGMSSEWSSSLDNAKRFLTYAQAREYRDSRLPRSFYPIVNEDGDIALTEDERIIEKRAILERTKTSERELTFLKKELENIGAIQEANALRQIAVRLQELQVL